MNLGGKKLGIRPKNKNVTFMKVDLEKREEVLRFGRWIYNELDRIDILINNTFRNSMYNVDTITFEE